MTEARLTVDEKLLARAGLDPAHAGRDVGVLAAAKLFELRRLTLGQAAELAGLSHWEFVDALTRLGIPWANLTPTQIEPDLRTA